MRSWVILCTLLLAPAASAVPVNLYAHTGTGMQDFVLNTQEPEPSYESGPGAGLAAFSGCVSDPTGMQQLTARSVHTWYSFASPGRVEYDVDENGRPRIHQGRGIADDIRLNGVATLDWYLEVADERLAALPVATDIVVRATLREGDDVSVGNAAFNSGKIIAQGETEPATLSPVMENPQVTHAMVGDTHVYGFHVPLVIEKAVIDAQNGFNLRVDAFMQNRLCTDSSDGGYVNPYALTVHESEGRWNHLALDVASPLSLGGLHVQSVNDDIVLHIAANSVFGNYDVAGTWLTMESDLLQLAAVVDNSRAHSYDDHAQPTTQSYLWDWQNTEPGTYPFTIRVENLQRTANITIPGDLRLDGAGPQVCFDGSCLAPSSAEDALAPGAPLVLSLLALAALALARRR